jgi:putative DNA primase/helicase
MRVVEMPIEDEADARPPEYSDEALALRFATARADALRYIASWGRWYEWSGVVWAPDDTLAAYDRVRHECRAGAAEIIARDTSATAKRQAANVASAKAVAAVERLTRSDRRLAATVGQWDSEREVFTTPGDSDDN